jgi:hypothetical protein
VTILPSITPNAAEKEQWLKELTEPYAQGCGHIRLMIENPTSYGLKNNFVIKSVIRVFYDEWWSAPLNEKQLFGFDSKLGPLIGRAIAIVENVAGCDGASPMATPSQAGSSLFVYHAAAIADFRKKVLAPFLIKQSNGKITDENSFLANVTNLLTTQLGSTVTNLNPANQVDLFSVKVRSG